MASAPAQHRIVGFSPRTQPSSDLTHRCVLRMGGALARANAPATDLSLVSAMVGATDDDSVIFDEFPSALLREQPLQSLPSTYPKNLTIVLFSAIAVKPQRKTVSPLAR